MFLPKECFAEVWFGPPRSGGYGFLMPSVPLHSWVQFSIQKPKAASASNAPPPSASAGPFAYLKLPQAQIQSALSGQDGRAGEVSAARNDFKKHWAAPKGVEDDDFLCFLDTHFELTRFKASRADLGLDGAGSDDMCFSEHTVFRGAVSWS